MGLLHHKHHAHHGHHAIDDEAEAARLDAEALLDEIATIHKVMQWYQPGEGIRFGASTRCPECGAGGFVVSSDSTTGNCINYCLECHADWVISLRALDAVAQQEATRPTMVAPSELPLRGRAQDREPVMLDVEDDLSVEATPDVLETFLHQKQDEHHGMTSF